MVSRIIKRLSIKGKIVGIFTILLVMISAFMLVYFPAQLKKEVFSAMEKRAMDVSEVFSLATGMAIGGGEFQLIASIVDLAKQDTTLTYLAILDTDGEEIFSYQLDDIAELWATAPENGVFEWRDLVNVAAPVAYMDEKIGVLLMGYSTTEVNRNIMVMRLLTLLIVAGIAISGLILVIFGTRYITRPIAQMIKVLQDLDEGEGDLTKRITTDSEDEIGLMANLFNSFVSKTQNLIMQIALSSEQVNSAASKISSSAEQMAAGAEEQQAQLSEVATTMEEMSAMILEASKNANETRENAQQTGRTAEGGREIVSQTVTGFETVVQTVERAAGQIESLSKRSEEIGNVIQVIDDIADQTNLLALNANIEAARAGDAGRGFAVVADEVRKLAERTVTATAEISNMIESIQGEIQDAVESMTAIQEQSKDGLELVSQSDQSLQEISGAITGVVTAVEQIATSTNEQSSGAQQISKNIEGVTTVAKESASSAQELAASAEQLNREVQGLNDLMGQFKVE